MGDGMHEKDGSGGHNAPPSPHPNDDNFSWLLARSMKARKSNDSDSTPATTSAPPSGGGPSGHRPAC